MFGNLITIGNFFINGMKELTFLLDKAVYSLVESVYAVFYYLASASILDDRIVENFTLRIYTILGILMVFILAWNLLNYIVDPDKITDKKIGATTFLKDVIIALVIISMSPMLFTKLYSFQSEVLSSGVIANLILGGNSNEDAPSYDDYASQPGKYKSLTDYYIQNGANTMVASVYVAFLYPNDGFTALDCDTAKDDGTYTTYCESYQMVKEGVSLNAFSDFITHDDYNFTPFLTTVAGIVLLFFMLSFCINLAKRVGKMAILQLLAPVPCSLELLPNKKGTRDNWIKTLVQVYCEVFMYLAVLYLVVFLISLIPNVIANVFSQVGGEGVSLVKLVTIVILIYGLLMFGKEAPQMVSDLLGIKGIGSIKEAFGRAVKMAGATTAGIGAGATGLTRNAVETFKNVRNAGNFKAGAAALGRGVVGMGSSAVGGAVRGAWMNRSGGFKGIAGTTGRAINAQAAAQRRTADALSNYARNVGSAHGKDRVKEIFKPAGTPFVSGAKAVGKWATGSNYGAVNAELQSYSRYKGVFDSTKVSTSKDDRYMSYQKDLDKLLTDNGMHGFYEKSKAWMKANGTSDINAYLASSDFATDFGAAGAYVAGDISNLSQAMSSRESSMILDKKSDITIALAQAKALVEQNTDIAKLAKDNGIDITSLDTSKFTSDADWIDAYDKLKELNKKASSRTTEIRAEIAEREMRKNANGDKDKK